MLKFRLLLPSPFEHIETDAEGLEILSVHSIAAVDGYIDVEMTPTDVTLTNPSGIGPATLSIKTFLPIFYEMLSSRGVDIVPLAVAAMLALAVFLGGPLHMAHAAPLVCEFQQADIAGSYASDYFTVDVPPCGGLTVYWMNQYGLHMARYYSYSRFNDGSLVAFLEAGQPYGLDGRMSVGLKPAERGFVQLVTTDKQGIDIRVYRLAKLGSWAS